MSHYCVAVFSRDEDDVDSLLAPFDENVEPGSEFAEFVEDDDCDVDEITGKCGYWHNPEAHWDWYCVGGRFSDMITLKDGSTVDSAKVSSHMFQRDKQRYKKSLRFWEVVVDGSPLRDGESKSDFETFWKPEYYRDRYKSKGEFADEVSRGIPFAFLTADGEWVEPGSVGWFGTDDATADSKSVYKDKFLGYLKKAADDGLFVTIVDCHI